MPEITQSWTRYKRQSFLLLKLCRSRVSGISGRGYVSACTSLVYSNSRDDQEKRRRRKKKKAETIRGSTATKLFHGSGVNSIVAVHGVLSPWGKSHSLSGNFLNRPLKVARNAHDSCRITRQGTTYTCTWKFMLTINRGTCRMILKIANATRNDANEDENVKRKTAGRG